MTTYLAALLTLIVVLGIVVVCLLAAILDKLEVQVDTMAEIRRLQLNPRTRMSQAIMDSGPPHRDKDLARAGRASQGKRMVVGGEQESQLYKDLNKEVEG